VISGQADSVLEDTDDTSYTSFMTNTNEDRPQALQAVLSRKNIEISCTLVFEDESASSLEVASVSVRGAQREITGMLVGDHGYVPAGRWSDDGQDDDGYSEWSRAFKPGQNATMIPWSPPHT
jgi:hypothetical protein